MVNGQSTGDDVAKAVTDATVKGIRGFGTVAPLIGLGIGLRAVTRSKPRKRKKSAQKKKSNKTVSKRKSRRSR